MKYIFYLMIVFNFLNAAESAENSNKIILEETKEYDKYSLGALSAMYVFEDQLVIAIYDDEIVEDFDSIDLYNYLKEQYKTQNSGIN